MEGVFPNMEVKVINNEAVIHCLYQEKELVKAIGDYKFNRLTASWIFPLKKLVEIIDNLHVDYSAETKVIYDSLVKEKQKYHSLVNQADKIKAGDFDGQILDQNGYDLLSGCYFHQKKSILLASIFGSYALFLEPGLGKTLISVRLIQYWQVPTMIVAPLSTLESVWVNEIEKWAGHLKQIILWQNIKAFNFDYDVYIINYEGFKKLIKESKTPIEKKIGCLILDESSKIKSHDSQITKTIISFSNKIKHKLILSGSPAPNSLLEYFSQMQFINEDLLGTSNFYKFRNTFFFNCGYGGYIYKPMQGAKESIMDRISRQAFSVKKEDALDLPEKTYETRFIYMDEVQTKAYEMMKKENILEFKEHTTLAANELAKLMKLRQVTSGFTITTTGLPVLISETKINALKELLEEIPEDKQAIIWLNFHFEIHRLKEEFKEAACTLYGELSQKEKIKNIEDFQNGKYRILLAHPLSGGMGINFQQCSYIIWYSLSYSSEQYIQANDRIHRIGQKNKCTYFHLLAKDTIDEIMYNVLNKKFDLIESCLNMLKGKSFKQLNTNI